MKGIPFFSIITASYNSEKTIAYTLQSVLDLEFDSNAFEYILIDGKSKDKTISIIQEFEPKFKEKGIIFTWISEPDKGIYDAWNKGVSFAKANWISFLGSDDFYENDALNVYFEGIKKAPEDCNYISSKVLVVDEEKQPLRVMGKAFNWNVILRNMNIAQVGSFHRKELLDVVGPFSLQYKIVGDLDFYIRSKEVIKPQFIDKITAKMTNAGVSNQIYPALKEALQVRLKYGYLSKFQNYFDFYFSLLKCYIKLIINPYVN